ncbi:ferrous iron transport protein B [Lachnoclostridium phytofermentans]|uniref:Ferrous iron transport protein B n=1 Tax=Lachnoclostridium phytofermentans (strain ATCC 700394 / DSM 18823 / ISDg) TaxID=357809 RepID=A9KN73_LACP7|nr:ferrous iron transport protein B [Lachnoclostridium phytofermentans]ABX41572.1 ferrous iron transport protein B [Lachnoclostridium phytofermentans ISDg]
MSIKIALTGNPNCGKTTLFNALTGSNQFVGNWPGVTVEKKEGKLKGFTDVILTDLPGIYSLSPYTLEEVVARNYLMGEKPDAIINIIDGTNLERNLYLTTQLLELSIPVIMAINMMDVVEKSGDKIHIDKLKEKLGCDIVEISALRGKGISDLAKKAVDLAQSKQLIEKSPRFSAEVEEAIESIEERLPVEVPIEQKRFVAIKLLEKDDKIENQFENLPVVKSEISRLEELYDEDTESIITNERYVFLTKITKKCYQKQLKEKLTTSDKIDRIVTNRILALPIFAVVMFLVYYVSVTTIGGMVTDLVNDGIFGEGFSFFGSFVPGIPVLVEQGLTAIGCADWLQGLILDGMIGGVGAVLGFVPQMLLLFLFLAFLESCGYMARVAFLMDRIFRKFGLSGKSFIPMLIGSGCGVPGIMASRTIESDRDRKMTIITTTFIPCSAKLPIIALIAGALFDGAWWVAPSAYFIGIAAIVTSGIILKKTKLFAGDPSPFVMEMPPYHMPTVGNILRSMWERGSSFIKKAGTIILLSTTVIWFAQSFGFTDGVFGMVEDMNDSVLAAFGKIIAPIFAPLGFGEWKSTVATITGLIAKENVVGTFGVLYGFGEVAEDGVEIWGTLASSMTTISAYTFLVFNLLCAPCFAAMGAIKREMNNARWFWIAVLYQTGFAYIVAFVIYQFGSWISLGTFGLFTVIAVLISAIFIYLLVRPSKRVLVK